LGRNRVNNNGNVMITDVFLFLSGTLLSAIVYILSLFNFAIPVDFKNSVDYLLSTLRYWQNAFPIDTLLTCLVLIFSAAILIYSYRIILWVYSMTPWFGRSGQHPKAGIGNPNTGGKIISSRSNNKYY